MNWTSGIRDVWNVRRDQAETSVLFERIAARYEGKSLAITANQPFSGWNQVFPEVATMTLAAVDLLGTHDQGLRRPGSGPVLPRTTSSIGNSTGACTTTPARS